MFRYLKHLALIGCAFLLAPSVMAQDEAIDRFAEVVDSLHRHIVFPHNIAPGIVLTNVGVNKAEKMLVINYMLNSEMVEAVADNAASENGIAQLLSGYDEIFSTTMIEANAGYQFIITTPSPDGLNKTRIVSVAPDAISSVYARLKNGDHSPLQPYLEMLQSTFSNMQLPARIAAGVYLTDGYIKDNEAHWIYRLEGVSDTSYFSEAVLQNNRINLINTLRANLSPEYLTEIEEKGITLHYTYTGEQGEILFEFILAAADLK